MSQLFGRYFYTKIKLKKSGSKLFVGCYASWQEESKINKHCSMRFGGRSEIQPTLSLQANDSLSRFIIESVYVILTNWVRRSPVACLIL